MQSRQPGRAWAAAFAIAFVVVTLGDLANLGRPLVRDQSLFLLGAHEMHEGAVLYRDFWDLKGPGVYLFYLVAGVLGGFTPLAVHAFALACELAFAAALVVAMRRFSASPGLAAGAAIAAIAPSGVLASPNQQIQVEGLAGLPLFLAAWSAAEGARAGSERTRLAWFAFGGVAAGFALALKLLFAPLIVLALVAATFRRSTGARQVMRDAAAVLAGALVPTLTTIAYFTANGALRLALDAWFVVPPAIVATLPSQHTSVLVDGFVWFVKRFASVEVLAAVGVVVALRRGTTALERALLGWLVAAPVVILAQRTSWWDYQWLLLVVPLGVFAAIGGDALVAFARAPLASRRLRVALAIGATCALLVLPLRAFLASSATLAAHHFALTPTSREAYRRDTSTAYRDATSDAHLVPVGGTFYAFGDPLIYLTTGRRQALALNGWSPELLIARQRAELERAFRTHPPRYLYFTKVASGGDVIAVRMPSLARFIARAYASRVTGAFGTLYAMRPTDASATSSGRPSRR